MKKGLTGICKQNILYRSTDKGYKANIFLISPRKHILWVLIRSALALLMSTHNICFCGEIRKISVLLLEKGPYLEVWQKLGSACVSFRTVLFRSLLITVSNESPSHK